MTDLKKRILKEIRERWTRFRLTDNSKHLIRDC